MRNERLSEQAGFEQAELPLAVVQGRPLVEQPRDLYIPPQPLRVSLPLFEGPLDLLLYLIRRNDFDILNLPVAEIAEQYMRYIEMMEDMQVEIASEYLVMSSTLVEIKSRLLLPRPPVSEEGEETQEDARAELLRKLIEYQRFKNAAINLDKLPRCERDFAALHLSVDHLELPRPRPAVRLEELRDAFAQALRMAELYRPHRVVRESLSVSRRIIIILDMLDDNSLLSFYDCFTSDEGRAGAVVTFLALLEMLRSAMVEIMQESPTEPLYIRRVS